MPGLGCCIEKTLIREAQPVVDNLRRKGLSVVTAESCTAGLIAAILSHAQGAGECLQGGFVVYTKEGKAKALGVSKALLESKGSVNREVAHELACGALERSPATIALSVTGVLGPDSDEDGNPPGLVYFGLCRSGREPIIVEERFAQDNPDAVRRAVVLRALKLLQEAAD
jgi:nicotinamide-nucleotide amidase